MKTAAALSVVCVLFASGCRPGWESDYEPLVKTEYPETNPRQIRFEHVEYEILVNSMAVEGYEALGSSRFRGSLRKRRPDAMDSKLRKLAAGIGADYVRWAEEAVGYRSYTQKDGPGHGRTISDYLAIFYKTKND